MADPVKAEVHAVQSLAVAVARYAEHVRGAGTAARAEAKRAEAKVHEAVEQRRQRLDRAAQVLTRAQTALACCRENCGGLQRAVNEAQRQLESAEREYRQARKAAQIVASAAADVSHSVHASEAAVGQHSSMAASALAELDSRLREITGGKATRIQNLMTTLGIVSTVVGTGQSGQIPPGFLAPAGRETTMSQRRDEYLNEQMQLWRDTEDKRLEDESHEQGTIQG